MQTIRNKQNTGMTQRAGHVLETGANECYDVLGNRMDCRDSGQDAARRDSVSTDPDRFRPQGETVHDTLTGLHWPRRADVFTYPLSWPETLNEVARLNKTNYLGHHDWRLPNRRELRSLISHGAKNPALPESHPFHNVFLGWYWTSTTSAMATAYAWRVQMQGGRMFYGKKTDPGMGWPVRGESIVLPRTGQTNCHDVSGNTMDCEGCLQDGALQTGAPWPEPRFTTREFGIVDRLTRLVWHASADLAGPAHWQDALNAVQKLNRDSDIVWRLPDINELESLVDASQSSPALPSGHPFARTAEAYWSSTTSFYETDWAYVLYMHKGAVGVGFKQKPEFNCWPVAGPL
ncbi:DUF1566 domain-containing protein [Pseudodesulfovibrio senegalensis]|nr:DUF1566 domain-containing protein [Pseudodesulfovibrio senegalensis]